MRKPLTQKQLRLVQYLEESGDYYFSVIEPRDSWRFIPHNHVRVVLVENRGAGLSFEIEGPKWPLIPLKVQVAEQWYEELKDNVKLLTQEVHDVEAYITEAEDKHEDT